ncbi:hypothetical protein SMC3_07480 [Candidatus Cryosericum hinesii]|jgi:hypothetical protein|uniref:Uncharacterized protein n=1 Tax=Candidatus Cryosericum hinesii TaxID=2290915 RepID=A0A398DJ45_9BACT|nr:hypothetical protein [Candidatus Cryosericum hinesii]RIE10236.1 hypothetical protein SMC4_02860 [Candidatus Cryosericum hinesii]RIE12227.1 hypothetical protein SMC3_07480 [Candidatus Cryosericum hinesii]RIE12361.1 hypothetical protein SMC2_07090 [Candidatus Cryosericum hinesii]
MSKRFLIAAGIVLLVVVVFVAGFFFWNFMNPNTIKKDEKAEVTALVENFGLKLKEVSLTAPGEIVSQEIETIYAPFVSSTFLLNLTNDPTRAPGRDVSSPWPEKIEIISMEKLDSYTIQVKGKIILMTSVEMAQGGNAGETPIMFWVRNTNARGAWLIDQLSYGEYAFYDGKELTATLKRAFPNTTSIGERGDPFIAQTIDMNGDSIPEALVDLQTGGAYTEDYTICQLENGKLSVANFRDKNMPLSLPKYFSEGASVQHEVKLSFANDGKGNSVIYQYTIDKSSSDPAVTDKITVEAYEWNGTTKEFGYDEHLSIAFEQEEEKLLMPGLQPVMLITDSTGNISTRVSLPKGISGKDVYAYLQNKILQPAWGGQMFCAYTLFGSEIKNNKVYIYLWALWEEYRSENRKLVAGTGMDGPITLIATLSQQGYAITKHQLPENGTAYAPSIKKMFPLEYYNEIFSKTQLFNTVIAKELMDNVEQQARKYYGLQ